MNNEIRCMPEIPLDLALAKKLWIHCNSCYESYIDYKSILFLLACQHIICEKCVTASLGLTPVDAPSFKCPICRKQVRGRQVNNALPSNLKQMFHPEPWLDGLPNDLINRFQKVNRINFEKHMIKKEKEMFKLDKDLDLAQKICRKHYLEQKRQRETRRQLEYRTKKICEQEEIKKTEQQRISSKRSISGSAKTWAELSVVEPTRSRSRSTSATLKGPEVRHRSRSKAEELTKPPGIKSFVHSNNNSFLL